MQSKTFTASFRQSTLTPHLAVYALLLLAMLVIFPAGGSFTSDDGAYAGQVYALQQGDWALERPFTSVAQANEGWLNSSITSDGPLPYKRHPGYAYLLLGSVSLFGDTYGLGVPSVVGAVLCVVAAWFLAAEYDRRSAPLAFWIVGLSPILVNATTFWAHTLAAGLAGFGLLAAVRMLNTPTSTSSKFWILTGVVGLTNAAAIFIRTEAVLWFAGLAVGLVLLVRSKRIVTMMTAAMAPTVGAFIVDRTWSQAILARYDVFERAPIEEPSWLASRVPAGFHLLLAPSDGVIGLVVVLGLALITYGALKIRARLDHGLGATLLVIGAVLMIVPVVMNPSTITGLVAAWPILIIAGIIGSKYLDTADAAPVSWLLVPVGLLTVAVLLTQYAASGGLEWGARYLSPAFVALGVWAALSLRALTEKAPTAVFAVVMAPAILGATVTYQSHVRHADFVAVAVADNPDIVVSTQPAATRIAWSSLPTAWYTANEDNVDGLLDQIAKTETERIAVIGLTDVVTAPDGYQLVEVSADVVHLVQR